MALTILSVAFPAAPVGPDAVGGAEQVLTELDSALVQAGHRSIVVAREDSRTAGTLVPVPRMSGDDYERQLPSAQERHSRAIIHALERWPIDLVHLHGVDFCSYLPPPGVPVLATLHLPVNWYSADALHPARPDTWLNCVSQWQHARCPKSPQLLPPVENGIATDFFRPGRAKRRFALVLARICPEKGIHHAIEAAKRAGIALLIAGEVFPYREHRRYFHEQVEPRLDRLRRFIGPVGRQRKRRLLAGARALIVPSLVPETSSLAAKEALACGTPVIAFARGALSETVEHERTGFLVSDETEMAQAIARAAEIDPQMCRRAARTRFSLDRMTARYFALYGLLASRQRLTAGAA